MTPYESYSKIQKLQGRLKLCHKDVFTRHHMLPRQPLSCQCTSEEDAGSLTAAAGTPVARCTPVKGGLFYVAPWHSV